MDWRPIGNIDSARQSLESVNSILSDTAQLSLLNTLACLSYEMSLKVLGGVRKFFYSRKLSEASDMARSIVIDQIGHHIDEAKLLEREWSERRGRGVDLDKLFLFLHGNHEPVRIMAEPEAVFVDEGISNVSAHGVACELLKLIVDLWDRDDEPASIKQDENAARSEQLLKIADRRLPTLQEMTLLIDDETAVAIQRAKLHEDDGRIDRPTLATDFTYGKLKGRLDISDKTYSKWAKLAGVVMTEGSSRTPLTHAQTLSILRLIRARGIERHSQAADRLLTQIDNLTTKQSVK